MKIKYLGFTITMLLWVQSAFSQIQLDLSNNQTSTYDYQSDLSAPVSSNLLRRNGIQLTGTQTDLTDGEVFQYYFDENQLNYNEDLGDTGEHLLFLSRNEIRLEEGFNIMGSGDGTFTAAIERKVYTY